MKTHYSITKSQRITLSAVAIAMMFAIPRTAFADPPADFPPVVVTTNDAAHVSDGYIFMTDSYTPTNYGYYVMMLTNDGSAFWYKRLTNAAFDFKELPNGYLHYAQQYYALTWGGGGYVTHEILDENFNDVESIRAGNGYNAECHDFKMLPNGHALVTSFYMTRVDMSKIVPNGNPAALVAGGIIQELDAQRNVVFQWRSWDHYPFTTQWVNSTAAVISAFHVNCVFEDTDGNIIFSTPEWVKKISRQTGQVMWSLGGPDNDFTFVGITPEQGTNAFGSHGINRLPNGHVLFYKNGGFGPGATSTVQEYALDETNKIATYIWSYTPSPAISGFSQGDAQRLANGNTFIGWGGDFGAAPVCCTEISGTNVVFQMNFNHSGLISYRAFRSPFPSASQALSDYQIDLATGNSYSFNGTGVSLDLLGGGGGYNRMTVTNEPYAPVYPLFDGKAPRVLPVRVNLSENNIDSISATINFDAAAFGVTDPTNTTVYYRSTTGQGVFLPQKTTYNPATGTLSVSMDLTAQNGDFGEFIFGYPDLPDLAIPPLLDQVVNYRGPQPDDVIAPPLADSNVTYSVNQERPILLSWSPAGIAAYYEFQISTNQDFSDPLTNVPYQTDAFFVWSNATANTTYYYRVRTDNDAGPSGWATGSFQTVAPFITLATPNGGEMWRRGLKYFVQWQGNTGGNVVIDLYKGGVYATTITNTPDTGAYQWQIGLGLVPGNDYTIRISSSSDPALFTESQAPFSIDMPYIVASSLTNRPDGQFGFNLVAPGASQVSIYASTNLLNWQFLQTVPVTNSTASFMDAAATNSARFYRFTIP